MPSCWIEVDLAALRHNFAGIQLLAGPGAAVIAVVKANAYGLGAVPVARVLTDAGCPLLAVTRVDEAAELRTGEIETPILLLAPCDEDEVEQVVQLKLTAAVSTLREAELLSAQALAQGQPVRCQLKINTGMNRFGVRPEAAIDLARKIGALPGVQLEGAFTHFANAAAPSENPTRAQFQAFRGLLSELTPLTRLGLFHCANSAALVRFPETRLLAVRPGTLLYGQFPAPLIGKSGKVQGLELRDPFVVKARIVAIQQLKAGDKVGYGSEWTAKSASRIALIACGYADGLTLEPRARPEGPRDAIKAGMERAARLLKNPNAGRTVTLRGQSAPLVGRIAMQTCTVDVTHLPEAQIGDEVTLPMRRVTAGAHLPRLYKE